MPPIKQVSAEVLTDFPPHQVVDSHLDPVTPATQASPQSFQIALRSPLTVDEALLAPPAQMRASYAERLRDVVEFVESAVPPQRRRTAPVAISGPILDRLKYIENENPLRILYLTLLTQAIDKDSPASIHPAFVPVIEQLSRDEAVLIFCLKQQHVELKKRNATYAPGTRNSSNAFYLPNIAPDVDPDEVPKGLVNHPKLMKMYLSHLLSLNLIKIKPPPKIDHDTEWLTWTVWPSEFGHQFLLACVPPPASNSGTPNTYEPHSTAK